MRDCVIEHFTFLSSLINPQTSSMIERIFLMIIKKIINLEKDMGFGEKAFGIF